MKNNQLTNQRRAERVPLALEWGGAQTILGAELEWPNHELSSVFDLSYFGLAAARPALFTFAPNDRFKLKVRLGAVGTMELMGRVAWSNDKTVGIEILETTALARLDLDRFLGDQLIGRHLSRVDKQFYGQSADFSVWYHGPGDTNIYLWLHASGQIDRAEIEVDGEIIQFDGKNIYPAGRPALIFRAMMVLSQIDESKTSLRPLMEALAKGAR